MVRPVLQDKITGDKERLLPYIRPLYEVFYSPGPDGIRVYRSHQVFGFLRARDPNRLIDRQVLPKMPSRELYLRNALITADG